MTGLGVKYSFKACGNSLTCNDINIVRKTIPPFPRLVPQMHERARDLRGDTMQSVFASWVGQAVILQVAAEDLCVPLCGVIVGETETTVRIRVGEDFDVDVFKLMILAVEQDKCTGTLVN